MTGYMTCIKPQTKTFYCYYNWATTTTKNTKAFFQKKNIVLTNPMFLGFFYFLQNCANLRIETGGEEKKKERRSCGKVTLLLFQRVGTGSTN